MDDGKKNGGARRPLVLAVGRLSPLLERALTARFRLAKLPSAEAGLDAAGEVRAIVAGGAQPLPRTFLCRFPALELVAIHGVGTDAVDLHYLCEAGVRLSTTPGALTDDVADHAVGLVYALARRIPQNDRFVRSGAWKEGSPLLGRRVTGRRYGILGMGKIGRAVARRLQPVAREIHYLRGRSPEGVCCQPHPDALSLARACDTLIITARGGKETRGLVDGQVLDALGPDGYLINVARGSIVDEAALVAALSGGRIAGAALDVFAHEPEVPPALLALDSVIVQPHQGSATREAREAMAAQVLAELEAALG